MQTREQGISLMSSQNMQQGSESLIDLKASEFVNQLQTHSSISQFRWHQQTTLAVFGKLSGVGPG